MTWKLARGINFGNALDASDETALALEERYFDLVKAAGFDTVRLPVAWSRHAEETAPYAIDEEFFARVDRAVAAALERDLNAVVNVHHYHALNEQPAQHADRFVALWSQIATRYADRSDRLHFELLNEACAALTPDRWNDLLPAALAAVRESKPDRTVLIGPAELNSVEALPKLRLPDDDHIAAAIHYYSPMPFTHQNAHWVAGSAPWLGTIWGSPQDRQAVTADLTAAASWAKSHDVPLFLGEFGAYEQADMPSRTRWTAHVRAEAERLGIAWSYWEFATDFGAYDLKTASWREPLRQALLPT